MKIHTVSHTKKLFSFILFRNYQDLILQSTLVGLSLSLLVPDINKSLVVLEPQARSQYWPRTQKGKEGQVLWAKRMSSAYIRVREVRGQVPGTTRGSGVNYPACGYVRAPAGVAQCLGLPRHWTEVPRYLTEAPRYRRTAPVAGATLSIRESSMWLHHEF